jgi:phosphatidate cytidylyltransferase
VLRLRLISAAIIIGVLAGLLTLDFVFATQAPGLWLAPLALIASVLLASELLDLWRDRPERPSTWVVIGGVVLTWSATAAPLLGQWCGQAAAGSPLEHVGWSLLGFAVAVALVFGAEMRRFVSPGQSTGRLALGTFAVTYAGLLLSFLMNLRFLHGHRWGMTALISLIVIVKLADTGAYFVGRAFGRHKMSPILSPKKTMEGALGALLAAGLGAAICQKWLAPSLVGTDANPGSLLRWVLFGLILAAAGMFGDLAESLLKRDAQRKDSSSWLPGLGGVLDILDSLLFAAPAAYICWTVGLIGPAGPLS